MWLMGPKYDPDVGSGTAYIESKEGPLPVGACTWQVASGGQWVGGTVTVELLVRLCPLQFPKCMHSDRRFAQTTEEEAATAEQRIQQAKDAVKAANAEAEAEAKAAEEADKAAKALAATEGDGGPRAVTISGAPQEKYNGTFGPRPKHNGWPRWGPNEGGMHLYYVPASVLGLKEGPGQWQMAGDFKPEDKGFANAQIGCADGPLPVGAHAWKFWNAEKRGFDEHTLMVAYR